MAFYWKNGEQVYTDRCMDCKCKLKNHLARCAQCNKKGTVWTVSRVMRVKRLRENIPEFRAHWNELAVKSAWNKAAPCILCGALRIGEQYCRYCWNHHHHDILARLPAIEILNKG